MPGKWCACFYSFSLLALHQSNQRATEPGECLELNRCVQSGIAEMKLEEKLSLEFSSPFYANEDDDNLHLCFVSFSFTHLLHSNSIGWL